MCFFREITHVHCLVRQVKKQRHVALTPANAVLSGVCGDDPGSLRRVESGTVLATVGHLCAVVEVEARNGLSQRPSSVLEAAVFDLSRPTQALVVEVAAGRDNQQVESSTARAIDRFMQKATPAAH
jgi:hypothetical protein